MRGWHSRDQSGSSLNCLVEQGQPAASLAGALVAPLERRSQRPGLSPAPAETILEEESGEPSEERFRARLQEAAGDDAGACDAFLSLDVWYRPAVAALGRAPEELRRAQARTDLSAYSLRITGVSDIAQLSVLLSEALAVPLRKIGASGVADEVMLANARGVSVAVDRANRRHARARGGRAEDSRTVQPSTAAHRIAIPSWSSFCSGCS